MAPNAQFIPGHGESTTILGFVSKPLYIVTRLYIDIDKPAGIPILRQQRM